MSNIDNLFDTANHGVYDMHTMSKTGNVKRMDTRTPENNINQILKPLVNVHRWLPSAAKALDISADINDYIITPIEIIRSDIPNCNGIAFPREELVRWNTGQSNITYQTWVGKGTYKDHANNTNPLEARGIIMDVALLKAPEFHGDFVRLIHLAGFDRSKDRALVDDIVARRRTSYSMGSVCEDYSCSICNKMMSDTASRSCEHISTKTARDRNASLRPINGRLAFSQARFVTGVEISSVESPAAVFAMNPNYLTSPR